MSEPAPGGWRDWIRTPVGLGVVALAVLVLVMVLRRGSGGEAGAAFGEQEGADCVAEYPDGLSGRDWAFDGVVTGTEPIVMPGAAPGQSYLGITFDVREWFAGGSGDEVTVAFPERPPDTARLLVSGGGDDPLVAWSECGFVRYYDPTTADDWRATF